MQLEDHLGDIVRKARGMSGVSASAAASVSGVSEADWSHLENTGELGTKLNVAAVASLLKLDPGKLQGIASGWLPATPDIGRWHELRQITTTESGNAAHCYLVWDEATREAGVFDAGWRAEPILELVAKHPLRLNHVFITHTHPDHMGGLALLREAFPKIQIHTDSRSAPAEHQNRRGECVEIGTLRVTHRETPGHAEDGVTYLVNNWPEKAPQAAIVGDAIFAGSMGRGNQSWDLARRKVREEILTLPADTLICPGHGPLTTVAEEREHNPFF